jgi:hypothetical protein
MQYFQVGENDRLKRRIYFHLVDATDGITPETGEAGGSAKVSLNGNTPTTSVNTLVAIDTTNQPGTYYLELDQSEIRFPGMVSVRYKSADTAEFVTLGQIMAFDPYTQQGQFGGGGGADVDYKRIKKLLDEAVSKIPKPESKEPDFTPLSEGLQAVITEVRAIRIPKPEKTDLEPVLKQVDSVKQAIKDIKMPETDLTPLLDRLDDCIKMMEPQLDGFQEEVDALFERIKTFFDGDMETVKEAIAKLSQKFEDIPYVVIEKKKEEKPDVLQEYLNLNK